MELLTEARRIVRGTSEENRANSYWQPSRRPTAALDLLDLFESTLTPAELATAETWLKQLSDEHRAAILAGLGGRR